MTTSAKRGTNVEIDREVWRAAKIAATQDDRGLAEWVEQAIRDALGKRNDQKGGKTR